MRKFVLMIDTLIGCKSLLYKVLLSVTTCCIFLVGSLELFSQVQKPVSSEHNSPLPNALNDATGRIARAMAQKSRIDALTLVAGLEIQCFVPNYSLESFVARPYGIKVREHEYLIKKVELSYLAKEALTKEVWYFDERQRINYVERIILDYRNNQITSKVRFYFSAGQLILSTSSEPNYLESERGYFESVMSQILEKISFDKDNN